MHLVSTNVIFSTVLPHLERQIPGYADDLSRGRKAAVLPGIVEVASRDCVDTTAGVSVLSYWWGLRFFQLVSRSQLQHEDGD